MFKTCVHIYKYVNLHIYIYISIYYIDTYIDIHMCMYICMFTYVFLYVSIYLHRCISICTYTHIDRLKSRLKALRRVQNQAHFLSIQVFICVHIHTHTSCIHMYTHTCEGSVTYTHSSFLPCAHRSWGIWVSSSTTPRKHR